MKTIRQLKFSDLGPVSKIIKKLQLRVEKGTTSAEELGASLFLKLLENYSDVENDVASFFANMIEDMTKEEFLSLPLREVLEYLEELRKDEGLESFLETLSKLMKTK